ncbi:MAG: GNAT family N-acetyltransferase [Bacillota bacterium]
MTWVDISKGDGLPWEWDSLAKENTFLKRSFLMHLERVNPCGQSYHILYEHGLPQAIYVSYQLKINILTYSFLKLKLPVTIMGIPCSVSKPGFFVLEGSQEKLLQHFNRRKGAKLILNSEQVLPQTRGQTLPACKLYIKWSDFAAYVSNMRSSYRYRIKQALKKGRALDFNYSTTDKFSIEHYGYYEETFNRSPYPLEKLSIDFFQKLTLPSRLLEVLKDGNLLGFAVFIENGEELIFLFTGFNHGQNLDYDIYLNLLLEIIKYGIDNRFETIDFGQTAEETKLKLGSSLEAKDMYINHSNPLINGLVNKNIKFFSYTPSPKKYHVFK